MANQLEIKGIMMRLAVFVMLSCISMASWAQSAPPDSWSKEEVEWVTKMRQTYGEAGLEFTDEQAADAVAKMRQKRQPVGVPESEWTEDERQMITAMRSRVKGQGRELSDEQAQTMVLKLRALNANPAAALSTIPALRAGAVPAMVPAPSTSQPQRVGGALSEEEMAARINAARGITDLLRFAGARDGFSVNGRRFVDPEGQVVMHAHNVVTKNIGYIVRRTSDFAIKLLPKGDIAAEPLMIGTASWERGRWTVSTTTGKTVSGSSLSVAPDGVIVGRDSAAFVYQAGLGLQSVAIPEGYEVAPMQHGDVSGTGYLLIARIDAKGGEGAVGKAASSIKSLGALVGIGKKEDYAMMEIQSGRLMPMNIDAIGNDVHVMSGCVPVNAIVNKCSSMRSFESLYDETGRNNQHYFWRAAWFPTPSGPVAVSLENGVKDVLVTDLKTGKRVTAFRRVLGINGYDAEQNAEGLITVKANWLFTDHVIADAGALLRGEVTGTVE